jgi:hypothetical protein
MGDSSDSSMSGTREDLNGNTVDSTSTPTVSPEMIKHSNDWIRNHPSVRNKHLTLRKMDKMPSLKMSPSMGHRARCIGDSIALMLSPGDSASRYAIMKSLGRDNLTGEQLILHNGKKWMRPEGAGRPKFDHIFAAWKGWLPVPGGLQLLSESVNGLKSDMDPFQFNRDMYMLNERASSGFISLSGYRSVGGLSYQTLSIANQTLIDDYIKYAIEHYYEPYDSYGLGILFENATGYEYDLETPGRRVGSQRDLIDVMQRIEDALVAPSSPLSRSTSADQQGNDPSVYAGSPMMDDLTVYSYSRRKNLLPASSLYKIINAAMSRVNCAGAAGLESLPDDMLLKIFVSVIKDGADSDNENNEWKSYQQYGSSFKTLIDGSRVSTSPIIPSKDCLEMLLYLVDVGIITSIGEWNEVVGFIARFPVKKAGQKTESNGASSVRKGDLIEFTLKLVSSSGSVDNALDDFKNMGSVTRGLIQSFISSHDVVSNYDLHANPASSSQSIQSSSFINALRDTWRNAAGHGLLGGITSSDENPYDYNRIRIGYVAGTIGDEDLRSIFEEYSLAVAATSNHVAGFNTVIRKLGDWPFRNVGDLIRRVEAVMDDNPKGLSTENKRGVSMLVSIVCKHYDWPEFHVESFARRKMRETIESWKRDNPEYALLVDPYESYYDEHCAGKKRNRIRSTPKILEYIDEAKASPLKMGSRPVDTEMRIVKRMADNATGDTTGAVSTDRSRRIDSGILFFKGEIIGNRDIANLIVENGWAYRDVLVDTQAVIDELPPTGDSYGLSKLSTVLKPDGEYDIRLLEEGMLKDPGSTIDNALWDMYYKSDAAGQSRYSLTGQMRTLVCLLGVLANEHHGTTVRLNALWELLAGGVLNMREFNEVMEESTAELEA